MAQHSDVAADLGRELYELMLGHDGASRESISRKSALMSLSYLRAEAAEAGSVAPTAGAIADAARASLKQEAQSLELPDLRHQPLGADYGTAASYLLGLEPGTRGLLLYQRRDLAAHYTGRTVRTMTKQRHNPARPSLEQRLMNALGAGLWAREVEYLRALAASYLPRPRAGLHAGWARPYADLHEVWATAQGLCGLVGTCCIANRSNITFDGADFPATSLASYALLTTWLRADLGDDPRREARWMTSIPARPALSFVRHYSPFDLNDHARLGMIAEGAATRDQIAEAISDAVEGRALLSVWRKWLQQCECEDPPAHAHGCHPGYFIFWLGQYAKAIEGEWSILQGAFTSPRAFHTATDLPSLWWRLVLKAR